MLNRTTIYRNNGDTAEVSFCDAREAVQNHPAEWSFEPFSPAQMAAAHAKQDERKGQGSGA
ncbi:hypothetical protein [Rhizobium tropici]|uniref:Uncharacterized protein n=1 Tax=Rhizobium tropici TaxID=398 RepID=A0A329YF38_RHITR|nr:hypothetical protein [Rhizobium tropici]RAX40744.1 hypothetical protein DQ393_15335 [Rhizobium tropici]